MSTGPNVASLDMPMMTSTPGAAIGWTMIPSTRAPGAWVATLCCMVRNAWRTSSPCWRCSLTPPTSDLCTISGEAIFSTTG